MTEQPAIVPRLAFVINLAQFKHAGAPWARVKHLMHLFHGHRLPATWAVADADQGTLLQDAAAAAHQIALVLDENWADSRQSKARFRQELGRRLAMLSHVNAAPRVVVGDHNSLSGRMTILAERGIRAVFADAARQTPPFKPRPLPHGIWLLAPQVRWPKRRILRWLPGRATSLKELLQTACDGHVLVAIAAAEWEQTGVRGMQSPEKLLREVSWSASRGDVRVVTVAEIVAELSARHAVKPQRSILRLAA
jgi:hypothetical protein